MERPSLSAPAEKSSPSLLQKMRDFAGRAPKEVRTAARIGALLIGQATSEQHEAAENLADVPGTRMEEGVRENKKTLEARRLTEKPGENPETKNAQAFQKYVEGAFDGHPSRVDLNFRKGFETLTPDIIQKIVKSDAKIAHLVSGPEQFPDADQLGGLAKSEKATVYLNSQAYDANQARYLWLKVANKIKPDREMPA